jgi:hypothetical protein
MKSIEVYRVGLPLLTFMAARLLSQKLTKARSFEGHSSITSPLDKRQNATKRAA